LAFILASPDLRQKARIWPRIWLFVRLNSFSLPDCQISSFLGLVRKRKIPFGIGKKRQKKQECKKRVKDFQNLKVMSSETFDAISLVADDGWCSDRLLPFVGIFDSEDDYFVQQLNAWNNNRDEPVTWTTVMPSVGNTTHKHPCAQFLRTVIILDNLRRCTGSSLKELAFLSLLHFIFVK